MRVVYDDAIPEKVEIAPIECGQGNGRLNRSLSNENIAVQWTDHTSRSRAGPRTVNHDLLSAVAFRLRSSFLCVFFTLSLSLSLSLSLPFHSLPTIVVRSDDLPEIQRLGCRQR